VTPDEVVARAKELVGEEVLLTVRGTIGMGAYLWHVEDEKGTRVTVGWKWQPNPGLVSIEPAPMRIVKGQRYADAEGRLFEGDADGGLWELAAGYILAGEVWELDGLRPVKVVDQ
jgi:hypothetical protein